MNSITELHLSRATELIRNSVLAAISCSNQSVVTVVLPSVISNTDKLLFVKVLDQLSTQSLQYNLITLSGPYCLIELTIKDSSIHDEC